MEVSLILLVNIKRLSLTIIGFTYQLLSFNAQIAIANSFLQSCLKITNQKAASACKIFMISVKNKDLKPVLIMRHNKQNRDHFYKNYDCGLFFIYKTNVLRLCAKNKTPFLKKENVRKEESFFMSGNKKALRNNFVKLSEKFILVKQVYLYPQNK